MMCPFGSFPTFRHNEVRDLTATLLTEVCHNVAIEPTLQPIAVETFPYATANTADNARLDVKARAFGAGDRMLSLMYGYFIQMLPVIVHLVSLLLTNAMKMLRNVNMAIGLEKLNMVSLPHLCLLLLVVWVERQLLSINVLLTYVLATHWGQPYSTTIHWLRCRMSFALPSHTFREPVFHTQPCSGTTRLVSYPC